MLQEHSIRATPAFKLYPVGPGGGGYDDIVRNVPTLGAFSPHLAISVHHIASNRIAAKRIQSKRTLETETETETETVTETNTSDVPTFDQLSRADGVPFSCSTSFSIPIRMVHDA